MLHNLILIFAGLLLLWLGSELIIRSGTNIARYFGVSQLFIGFAFVSIGTSIPEIAVSVKGGLSMLSGVETSGIVIGNAIGSALNQITLIMGVLGYFLTIKLAKEKVVKYGSALIGAIILIFVLSFDGRISVVDGWICLLSFFVYYFFLFKNEKIMNKQKTSLKAGKDFVFLAMGIASVILGADFVVENGVLFANALGISQSIIGIFLVGLGSGLPELSVAITSALKKTMDISIGNLVGSNIVDLLLSLSAGAVISGFTVARELLIFDLPVLLLVTVLFLFFLFTNRISRKESLALIGCFVVYTIVKLLFFR